MVGAYYVVDRSSDRRTGGMRGTDAMLGAPTPLLTTPHIDIVAAFDVAQVCERIDEVRLEQAVSAAKAELAAAVAARQTVRSGATAHGEDIAVLATSRHRAPSQIRRQSSSEGGASGPWRITRPHVGAALAAARGVAAPTAAAIDAAFAAADAEGAGTLSFVQLRHCAARLGIRC